MKSLVAALLLFTLATASVPADVPGNVIVARAGSDAVLIWDATSALAGELSKAQTSRQSLDALEVMAATLAVQRFHTMVKANSIMVRVVYQRIGSINPAYGSATFAGDERLMTVSAKRLSALASEKSLQNATALPPAFSVNVVGQMPAQH